MSKELKYLLATRGLSFVETVASNDELQDTLTTIRQIKTTNGKPYSKVGIYLKIAEIDPHDDVMKSHLDNFTLYNVYRAFSTI